MRARLLSVPKESERMDKQPFKGAADGTSGAMKDAAGKMNGDKKPRAEGHMDKAKGAAREFIGDAKDARRKTDKGDIKH